jgi:2-keto-4-pentenoate hydratase/2-oxohepta-3-ene-1,7-dioic acid hydratase in catechol pathway
VRIARFVHPGGPAFGVVEGETGQGVAGQAGSAEAGALTVAEIEGHPFGTIRFTGQRWALDDVRLLSPILPSKVVCIGKNYRAHAQEMGGDAPERPLLFLKPSTAVIGTQDAVRIPVDAHRVEHEAELAVVIGASGARDVSAAKALDAVFGYTCGNDVTARDQQRADGQWTRAKGHDSFCPLGPWIETQFDPSDLRVQCTVNDEPRQDGRTADLVHDVATLVSYASHVMTLLPGDVLLTGTPAGVGPLVAGDTVSVTVSGIGTLTNSVTNKS